MKDVTRSCSSDILRDSPFTNTQKVIDRPHPMSLDNLTLNFGPTVSMTMALTLIRALSASLKQILIDNMPEKTWSKREEAIQASRARRHSHALVSGADSKK